MRVDTFKAEIRVRYTTRHSLFPDIKLGENARFDVVTPEGKVIANMFAMEKKKFGVGEESLGCLTIRWLDGINEEYKHISQLPIIIMNEELGICEIIKSSIVSTTE